MSAASDLHTEMSNDADILKQSKVGSYLNRVTLLGRGGYGVVYKAYHVELDRWVAIKVLSSDVVADDTASARFLREAQSLAQIDHPNVVKVFAYGRLCDGRPYIVMEYLERQTLTEIQSSGLLPQNQAIRIFKGILKGVGAMHRHNLVHRDLSPNNCMVLATTDDVKIVDFGLVKPLSSIADEKLTVTGQILGTAAYISPEACMGGIPDKRSDIYSLGCLLYFLLTGRPPFIASSFDGFLIQHVNGQPKPMHIVRDDKYMQPELQKVVATALEKNPENRYQSVDEFDEALTDPNILTPVTRSVKSKLRLRNVTLILSFLLLAVSLSLLKNAKHQEDSLQHMLTLKQEEQKLATEISQQKGASTGSAEKKVLSNDKRERLFAVKLDLARLSAQGIFSENKYFGAFQTKAGDRPRTKEEEVLAGYASALELSNGLPQTMEVLDDLFSIKFQNARYGASIADRIIDLHAEAVRQSVKIQRIQDAVVLYRLFATRYPDDIKHRTELLTLIIAHSIIEKVPINTAMRHMLAERILLVRQVHPDSDLLAGVILDLLYYDSHNKDAEQYVREVTALVERIHCGDGISSLLLQSAIQMNSAKNAQLACRLALLAKTEYELSVRPDESLATRLRNRLFHAQALSVAGSSNAMMKRFNEAISYGTSAGEELYSLAHGSAAKLSAGLELDRAAAGAGFDVCNFSFAAGQYRLTVERAQLNLQRLSNEQNFRDRDHFYMANADILASSQIRIGQAAQAEYTYAQSIKFFLAHADNLHAAMLQCVQAEHWLIHEHRNRAKQLALEARDMLNTQTSVQPESLCEKTNETAVVKQRLAELLHRIDQR